MKRLRLALLGVVATLLLTAAPASAITYGQPDDGEHPYVGFMIFFDPVDPGWFSCSGTLLNPTVFLTAGHCTFNIGNDGEHVASSGGNDVWVTFDDTEVLAGWPARADFPTEEALYVAQPWLNANPDYTKATAFPSPDYAEFANFPENHDVGVVVLDDDAPVDSFGVLAPLGTINEHGQAAAGSQRRVDRDRRLRDPVDPPHPMDVETRYKSTSRIASLTGRASKDGNVHTLNNPSDVGGRGGSCFGDSGGPLLVNNTNQVVAVVSYGFSSTCHGADYSWRVDTQPSYDFILPFLD